MRSGEISDLIKAKIDSGEFPIGRRIPSERSLARMLGSSQVTVNKAISILAAKGMVEKRRCSGNYAIRRFRSKSAAFLLERMSCSCPDPFWHLVFEAFHMAAAESLVSVNPVVLPSVKLPAMSRMLEPCELAVVAASVYPERLEELSSLGVPLLFLGERPEPLPGPCVHFDSFEAGRLAAKRFAREGRRSLLYVGTMPRHVLPGFGGGSSAKCLEGFRRGAEESGGCVVRTCGPEASESLSSEILKLLKARISADGVLCFFPGLLRHVREAARKAGRKIPRDISLAVVGDETHKDPAEPLSFLVARPAEEMGLKLFELSIRIFSGEPVKGGFPVPPRLVP